MSNLIIRDVTITDFSQWQSLWDGYNSFYGRLDFPSEITELTWSRFFDKQDPVYALVAEQNDQLLGLAHYLFHRSTIQIQLTCYLQDLYTHKDARNQGIGGKLIQEVYKKAQIAGSKRVYWQTQKNNNTARKLYDKFAEATDFMIYRKNL